MAFVYWIRTPDMTDMLTQGYIGFTSGEVPVRFKKHVQDALGKNKRNYTLHNAIRKYGVTGLVVQTLVEGSDDYCLELEAKLRGEENLGWNQAVGGSKPCGRKTRPTPEETRSTVAKTRATLAQLTEDERRLRSQRSSEARKVSSKVQAQCKRLKALNTGKKLSQEHKEKCSAALRGRVFSTQHKENIRSAKIGTQHSQATRDKISQSKLDNNQRPWEHPQVDGPTWCMAVEFFETYVANGRCGHKRLRTLMAHNTSLKTMVREFEDGWIPEEDSAFLAWRDQQRITNESTFST